MKKTLWTALLVAALGAYTASASIIINVSEVGGDVVVTASGSLDTTGLDVLDLEAPFTVALAYPLLSWLTVGSLSGSRSAGVDIFTASSSDPLGGDVFTVADSYSGDYVGVGIPGDDFIFLPEGYVSGTALSGTATWNSTTIAELGFNTGSYTYNTHNGTDSLTVNIGVVPEPATAGLLGISVGALWLFRRLKKAANYYRT